MKKNLFIGALFCSALLMGSQAIAADDKEVAALKTAHASILAAIAAFDGKAIAEATEGRFLFMPNKNIWPGFFEDKKVIEKVFNGVLSNRVRFDLTPLLADYVVADDTGIISGILKFHKFEDRNGEYFKKDLYGRFTRVFTKVDGEWKLLVANTQYVSGPAGSMKR